MAKRKESKGGKKQKGKYAGKTIPELTKMRKGLSSKTKKYKSITAAISRKRK